jgi:hypothetical protein
VRGDLNNSDLSELSRHYDSMLWTVTSLWAAAIGGLLVYCTQHFDWWLALLGLILTVCAMFFAASFRRLRSRVHDRMSTRNRALFESDPLFRQWNVFLVLFLVLTVSWVRLFVLECGRLSEVWIVVGVLATAWITLIWCLGR